MHGPMNVKWSDMFHVCVLNQQMRIYRYVQSHIIIQQQFSVTQVAIIRVSYNKNTYNQYAGA